MHTIRTGDYWLWAFAVVTFGGKFEQNVKSKCVLVLVTHPASHCLTLHFLSSWTPIIVFLRFRCHFSRAVKKQHKQQQQATKTVQAQRERGERKKNDMVWMWWRTSSIHEPWNYLDALLLSPMQNNRPANSL